MKGIKKTPNNMRKRVISLLLSALMVLSIVMPGGSGQVKYNAYAEGEEDSGYESVNLTTEEEEVTETPSDNSADVITDETTSEEVTTTESMVSDNETTSEEAADTNENTLDENTTDIASTEQNVSDDNDESGVNDIIESTLNLVGSGVDEDIVPVEDELVREDPSTDLENYVVDYNAKDKSSNTNIDWSNVDLKNTYTFTIYFTEDTVRQFIDSGDQMVYKIPEGINAFSTNTTIPIVITSGSNTFTLSNNPFEVRDGYIYFKFNTDDTTNFQKLVETDNAEFHLNFDGQFDGSKDTIKFADNKTQPVSYNNEKEVSVSKNSSGNIKDGYITYTITVSSTGYNESIILSDVIDSSMGIYDVKYKTQNSDYTESSEVSILDSATADSPITSLNYTIDKLYNGQSAIITYKAKITDSDAFISKDGTTPDGKVTIDNTASVTCSTDTDPNNNTATVNTDIKYTSISSKVASNINSTDGTVDWTITLNEEKIIALNNKKIIDTLSDNQDFYSDIIIKKYDANGNEVIPEGRITKPSTQRVEIPFTDTQPYSYVITYTTKTNVDLSTQVSDVVLTNTAEYEKYDTKTGSATIGIDDANKFSIVKEATEITSNYVWWTITVNVPKQGYDNLVIKDTSPEKWETTEHWDEIDKTSISVSIGKDEDNQSTLTPNDSGAETYTTSFSNITRTSDNKDITNQFTLTFKKSNGEYGLDANGESNRLLIIKYKTLVDQNWIDEYRETRNDYLVTHTNTVEGTADGNTVTKTADADIILPDILKQIGTEKLTVEIEDNGTKVKYPIYEFKIRVSPVVSDTIEIEDVLPQGFKIYTEDSDWSRYKIVVSDSANRYGTPRGTATVSSPDSNNKVTFTLNVDKNSEGKYYDYYWLVYYIIPKDFETLKTLDQNALNEDDDTLTLENTASYSGMEKTIEFDYIPNKTDSYTLTKTKTNPDADGNVNFTIEVNPEELELNNGDNITLSDSFTNLSIDYSTISITPAADVISCDVTGNKLVAVLKDSKRYTITYTSKINVIDGSYSNTAEVMGYTSKQSGSYNSAGGGTAGNIYSISIFKQEKGNTLKRLEGVKFQLFDSNKQPVKNSLGQDVIIETDASGKATFKGSEEEGYYIEKNKKYYFNEVYTPDGYIGIEDFTYNFTIGNYSSYSEEDGYVYVNGETTRVNNEKIGLEVKKSLQGAPDDLDLNTIKFTVKVREITKDGIEDKEYSKTLAEIKEGYDAGNKYYGYDSGTDTYSWYLTNLEAGSSATVKETIVTDNESEKPNNIAYTTSDGISNSDYREGSEIPIDNLALGSTIKNITFTNSYKNVVEVTPVVYKKLDGRTIGTGADVTFPLDDLSFGFDLYELNDDVYVNGKHTDEVPENKLLIGSNWKTSSFRQATASDSTGGAAEFETIPYDVEGNADFPQYYYYKIVEDTTSYDKITNDTGYIIMTVELNRDSTGNIDKEVTYTKYNASGTSEGTNADPKEVAFNNTTNASGELILKANKYLRENGREIVVADGLFNFTLEPIAGGTAVDSANTIQPNVANVGNNVTFAKLYYAGSVISGDISNPTVYRYKISEGDVSDSSYTKDGSYYYVDVVVTRDTTDGGVKAEIKNITKYNADNTVDDSSVSKDNIDFNNVKVSRTGSIILKASKTLDGLSTGVNGADYDKFNFCMVYVGEESSSLKPDAITEDTNITDSAVTAKLSSGDNVVIFPALNYSTENGTYSKNGTGKHIYKIYEDDSTDASYSGIDNSKDYYIVVVEVKEPASGNDLDVSVSSAYKYVYNTTTNSYNAATPVTVNSTTSDIIFDNKTKPITFKLDAQKAIDGGEHSKSGFVFEITSDDYGTSYSGTAVTDADGKAEFSALSFSLSDKDKDYTFKVKEKTGNDSSLDYDKSEYTVTVHVSVDNDTKGLKADVTSVSKVSDPSDATATSETVDNKKIVFTNTLKPNAGSITFTAKKQLKKAGESDYTSDLKDEDGDLIPFEFNLDEVSADLSTTTTVQHDVQNDKNGNVTFDTINYTSADDGKTYYYKISEVTGTGGYVYSTDIYYVKVEVSKVDNRMVATPTYYKGSIDGTEVDADEVIFKNEEKTVSLILKAHKKLIGADNATFNGKINGFTFIAKKDGSDIEYEGYNDETGLVEIPITETFGVKDVILTHNTPYVYTISEKTAGLEDKFECSDKTYKAKVVFNIDGGEIVPDIKYYDSDNNLLSGDSAVIFENTKKGTAKLQLTAKKVFDGAELGNKKFDFELYKGEYTEGVTSNRIQQKQNDADGKVVFDELTFTQDDITSGDSATITYTIREFKPDVQYTLPGYNFDSTTYTVTVTLTRVNNEGISLSYTVRNNNTDNVVADSCDSVIFTNSFLPSDALWPLSAKKTLEGNVSMIKDIYIFNVYEADEHFNKTNPSNPVATAKNDESGNIRFGEFLVTSNTTLYYVVEEETYNADGLVKSDTKKYNLKITTGDDVPTSVVSVAADGTESPVVLAGDITFTNTIEVKVTKQDSNGNPLSGATLKVTSAGADVATKDGSLTTDGISHNIYSGITVGQEYVLSEVSAPTGYKKAEDITFRVIYDDASHKYVLQRRNGSEFENVDGIGDGAITIVMKDEEKHLVINKKTETNGVSAALNGAKLKITQVESGAVLASEWTTDGTGKDIALKDLDADKWYKLEETEAPFGYKKADSILFMIKSADNELYVKKESDTGDGTILQVDTDGKYYLNMIDEPITLDIIKYNKDKTEQLSGAVFQIYEDGGSLIRNNISVGDTGKVSLDIVALRLEKNKDYVLEETTAPIGYDKADKIKFRITADNKLIIDGGTPSDIIRIEVCDRLSEDLYIYKIDPANQSVGLAHAQLIVSESGNVIDSFTTTSEPHPIPMSKFERNKTYILRENYVPKDSQSNEALYYKAADISFRIDSNDVLWVKKADSSSFVQQTGNNSRMIVMEDVARQYVKISKVDIAGDELPGALLKITDANGNPVYEKTVDTTDNDRLKTTDRKLEHESTGEKWEIDFATFDLNTPYVLTEVTAPAGYEVAESITFMLVVEGEETVVKVKDGNEWVSKSNMTVVMEDAPVNDVSFVKIDESTGDRLIGAGLTIYDKNDNEFSSWTTGSSAKTFGMDEFTEGDEYTLEETRVPDGFKRADSITFKIEKITNPGGSTEHKLYIKNSDGDFDENTLGIIRMYDERIYSVKISKWDITHDKELPGATIEILDENGNVVRDEDGNELIWTSESSAKEIHGLNPNVTYTLRETVAPEGYRIATDTVFELNNDGTINTEKTSTKISTAGVLLVEDSITSLNFTKYGLVNESCAPDPAAYEALEGVEFAAYKIADDGSVADTAAMTAKSNASGTVIFNQLPKGKYEIRETKTVEPYIESEEVYYAVVDDNDFAGLTDKDGNKIFGNRIVNDQYRTDIVFTKVSERNRAKKLAGSTYGLYRKDYLDNESLIAKSVSDEDGIVRFEGVVTGTKYVIRELESPEGYYVSENPIEISFKLSGTDVVTSTLNDGKGTIVLGANGEITWLEPSVVVNFLKVDENGTPMAGATLQVRDMNGVPVKDAEGNVIEWVSTTSAYEVADVFEDGVSYQLVELAAPEGYSIAAPVVFDIPSDGVETGENKLISITMKNVPITTTTVTPPAPKTGDSTPVIPVAGMMMASLAGMMYIVSLEKKQRRRRRNFYK